MRGDLHHLFACEPDCNSFRGNTPYYDFPDTREVVHEACGKREEGRFEPGAGKGAVARATLYFLLRYPGLVGDEARELQRDRLETLLAWHAAEPVASTSATATWPASSCRATATRSSTIPSGPGAWTSGRRWAEARRWPGTARRVRRDSAVRDAGTRGTRHARTRGRQLASPVPGPRARPRGHKASLRVRRASP